MPGRTTPNWIAVDWGTSHLRIWAMGADGVLAEAGSDDGMGALTRAGFEPALLRLISPWLGTEEIPVVVCGMAGARQGWAEAPYRAAPCPADLHGAVRVKTSDPRLRAFILPGVKQAHPADVMRGEETQIAGFIRRHPDWDGTLVMPGSHCKWVQISAREIVSFRTALTGEMFAALSNHTVLRHTLQAGWDESAFDEGVASGLSHPEQLPLRLFGLRAEALLDDLDGATARARLSGFLLGMELAAMRGYWLGQQIALVGEPELSALYARALIAQGAPSQTEDATALTLEGLSAAHGALKESPL